MKGSEQACLPVTADTNVHLNSNPNFVLPPRAIIRNKGIFNKTFFRCIYHLDHAFRNHDIEVLKF